LKGDLEMEGKKGGEELQEGEDHGRRRGKQCAVDYIKGGKGVQIHDFSQIGLKQDGSSNEGV